MDFVIIRDETMSPEAQQVGNLNLTTSIDDEEHEEEQVGVKVQTMVVWFECASTG